MTGVQTCALPICGQSSYGIVRNQEKVSQAYKTLVSTKRLYTKQITLHFVVGNERFSLLLGTNNTLRIFMVLLETKSALVIKISQGYWLFIVWNSDLFSICFFRWLDVFFQATLLKFRTQVSGDMTASGMTLGWLDRLPINTLSHYRVEPATDKANLNHGVEYLLLMITMFSFFLMSHFNL